MNLEVELRLIFALVLIFLSGFFSSAETVFFSIIGQGGLGRVEEERPSLAKKLSELTSAPRKLISSILIGNEIVNILISILIASVFARLFLSSSSGEGAHNSALISIYALIISSGLILIFGEVIPKTLGVRFSFKLARIMTVPLYWFHKIIFPLRYLLRRLSELILRAVGIKISPELRILEDQDLLELVEIGESEGILDETEYELIRNIFEFGDLRVAEVMTPRQEIFALPLELEYPELKKRFLESGYSRVPIYQGELDQVVGILSAKDLIRLEASGEKFILDFLHPPYCVPPQKKLEDLLRDFLTQRVHFALVVNEYGEVIGLVTLEDLLEEIFGEGPEEEQEPELKEISEGKWEVLGKMELRDFNEKMNCKLQGAGVKTLAGYLLNEFGRLPEVGEELEREGYRFRIKEIRRRRIHRIELEQVK